MTNHTTKNNDGPWYCGCCGAPFAMQTALGLRCHLCELRDWAAAHPVPLPESADMLLELARIGVPGAAEKFAALTKAARIPMAI